MAIPIPQELLDHPAINEHPHIRELHQTYGGVPADADDKVVDSVLGFANAVAAHAVEPGTRSRRTDPSPRRTARVWRSQILGYRDASTSRSPDRRGSVTFEASGSGSGESASGSVPVSPSMRASHSPSPARARYRSRSRPPTQPSVKEEPEDITNQLGGGGTHTPRTPGRRDMPMAGSALSQLEHRVSTMTQQQHEFHERLVRRVQAQEKMAEQAQARNTNKVNAYLGRPLVPVSNGRDALPRDLQPLTSPEMIRNLSRGDVDRWIEYYTGVRSVTDEKSAKQALRACTGVDVQLL